MWNGKTYTREELGTLQGKNRAAVIIDDVVGIARGEITKPETLEITAERMMRKGDQNNGKYDFMWSLC